MAYSKLSQAIESWNQKLHMSVGLFLLLFIWLFFLSGLLLNHSKWEFASFWEEREEKEEKYEINIPISADSATAITGIMEQLQTEGEVSNVNVSANTLDFRASKPGRIKDITVDLKTQNATVKEIKFNTWGIIRTLHTFNGMDSNAPQTKPNWIITHIWRFTMDVVAIGLIFICISSWYRWYKTSKNFTLGLLIFFAGVISSAYFVLVLSQLK